MFFTTRSFIKTREEVRIQPTTAILAKMIWERCTTRISVSQGRTCRSSRVSTNDVSSMQIAMQVHHVRTLVRMSRGGVRCDAVQMAKCRGNFRIIWDGRQIGWGIWLKTLLMCCLIINCNCIPSQTSNLLSAVLCLVKELDQNSLEVVEHAVRCRIDELSDSI